VSASPLVSIIVPVYNSEPYLEACVNSILDQRYGNIELILVNDGSKDASPAICDRFAAQDSRVVVIHRENGGIAAAQNSGLDAATGELITFCDNDDLMSPQLVGRLVEILLSTGSDMSCCRWYNVGASVAGELLAAHRDDAPGRMISFTEPGRAYQEVFSLFLRKVRKKELLYFSEANWGKLYRAELFDGIRFPEGQYAQDVAVAMDLYARMSRVASCEDALYYWLQHSGSVSHSVRATDYYHDIIEAHGRSFDRAMEHGILPARAYTGLKTIRVERKSAVTPADRAIYERDRKFVRARFNTLSRAQRLQCWLRYRLRMAEVKVYNLTVHRRR